MANIPDPSGGQAQGFTFSDTAEFFLRRYLNIAIDEPIPVNNDVVLKRIEDLKRIEKADSDKLKAEFQMHPFENYAAMDADTRTAAIQAVFPDQLIEKVDDTSNKVRINGLVDFDAIALRRMAPSQREKIFSTSKMPEDTVDQKEAKDVEIKKLVGKMRLRMPHLADEGRVHLEGLLEPEHRAALLAHYNADTTKIEDQYRAWDILNKINDKDNEAIQLRERNRQRDTLKFAMDLTPTNLRDIVECFEFADLGIGTRINERALAIATARHDQAHETQKQNARDRPARLERDILEWEQIDREQRAILAQNGPDTKEGKAAQKQITSCDRRLPGMRIALGKARDVDPDAIPIETAPTSGSDLEKAQARDEVLEAIRDDPAARQLILVEMTQKFAEYVNAVTTTHNAAVNTPCALAFDDILPNANAAQAVADNLRFGANRAAAYHSLKHFKGINETDKTNTDFGTPVENQVGNYHLSARATVKSGNCAKSAVGQNGGESHHFKGTPCTAIVWLDGTVAGLATYFNI